MSSTREMVKTFLQGSADPRHPSSRRSLPRGTSSGLTAAGEMEAFHRGHKAYLEAAGPWAGFEAAAGGERSSLHWGGEEAGPVHWHLPHSPSTKGRVRRCGLCSCSGGCVATQCRSEGDAAAQESCWMRAIAIIYCKLELACCAPFVGRPSVKCQMCKPRWHEIK